MKTMKEKEKEKVVRHCVELDQVKIGMDISVKCVCS